MHQNRFWLGLHPGPRWGNLRRSPRPRRLGRGAHLLDAFGVAISVPLAYPISRGSWGVSWNTGLIRPIGHIFASDRGSLHFNAIAGVTPANIRLNFTSPETRMIVLPDDEKRTIVSSFVWTKHRNVTDGQTDGRTDRWQMAIAAVCIRALRTRCNNGRWYDWCRI